jgi:hypothetical protein
MCWEGFQKQLLLFFVADWNKCHAISYGNQKFFLKNWHSATNSHTGTTIHYEHSSSSRTHQLRQQKERNRLIPIRLCWVCKPSSWSTQRWTHEPKGRLEILAVLPTIYVSVVVTLATTCPEPYGSWCWSSKRRVGGSQVRRLVMKHWLPSLLCSCTTCPVPHGSWCRSKSTGGITTIGTIWWLGV